MDVPTAIVLAALILVSPIWLPLVIALIVAAVGTAIGIVFTALDWARRKLTV